MGAFKEGAWFESSNKKTMWTTRTVVAGAVILALTSDPNPAASESPHRSSEVRQKTLACEGIPAHDPAVIALGDTVTKIIVRGKDFAPGSVGEFQAKQGKVVASTDGESAKAQTEPVAIQFSQGSTHFAEVTVTPHTTGEEVSVKVSCQPEH